MFGWSAALPDPAENALAKKISAYWYSFAISPKGDPNPTSGTHTKWPEFTAVSHTTTAPSNLGSDRTMSCALARRAVL